MLKDELDLPVRFDSYAAHRTGRSPQLFRWTSGPRNAMELVKLTIFDPGLFGRPREARSNPHSLRRDSNPDASYSYFNALIGSTRDARCAGMKPAQSATSASATAESASTAGSAPVI
jgi:hypothetical protein